jgi:hypothetical protein
MKACLGRIFLVAAVLLAQQTAITHQLAHVGAAQAASKDAPLQKGDRLCGLHDLLGTVLGVATGPALGHELLALADVSYRSLDSFPADDRRFAPQSRGPPAIS